MTQPPPPAHQPYGQPHQSHGQPAQPHGQPNQQLPAQHPQNQPAPPQGAPGSALKFTVQGTVMTSNLVAPTLTIDGFPAPAALGSTMIPIQAGNHHLEVYSQWMRRYGQATLDVSIAPNSMVEVFYAAPMHQFTAGSMGLTKQKRKGLGVLIGILAVFVVLIVVLVTLWL